MTPWKEALEKAAWEMPGDYDISPPARLAAALASLEQSGYVVVPREPSETAMRVGAVTYIEASAGIGDKAPYMGPLLYAYRAMITASEKERDSGA